MLLSVLLSMLLAILLSMLLSTLVHKVCIYAKEPWQEIAAYLALQRSGGDTSSSARAL